MYLNFERRINIGKKRNIYPYEQYHKYINGVLYKKCVYHEEYFPNEDPWFECTNEFFYINPKNKSDGLCPACIKCSRLKSRQWQIDNPERYKETCYKKNRNPSVNSVDLCREVGCDYIFSYKQGGIGLMFVKDNEWIGYIDDYVNILGDDYIINKIVIYKNPKLSYDLTQKYMGKILITSKYIDYVES